jgi:uncharacterized repeat protein (TIGR03803 family)
MRLKKQYFATLVTILLTVLMAAMHAAAQAAPKERILVNFSYGSFAGALPNGGLISDAAGNFYGVTDEGGLNFPGNGTVFELSPAAKGGWTIKSIYLFQPGTGDGQGPLGGLVMDSSGNLYGTTQSGGTNLCTDDFDIFSCGTIFQLSPNGSGGWSEKVIYNFSERDGYAPGFSLVMDSAGNLYGTAGRGGHSAVNGVGGAAFELRRSGKEWTYRVLHYFAMAGTQDGAAPSGPLVFDKAGNLYGETLLGGQSGGGTVFELTHTTGGWKENILFSFGAGGSEASGLQPNGGLIFDSAGNLYGTTYSGGIGYGFGTVFELTPTNGGAWNETVLYDFLSNGDNEANPVAGLVMDSAGNLYGTTYWGGSTYRSGNLFELRPSPNGAWTFFVVHSFQGFPTVDGQNPNSNLLIDSKGNLYGTTYFGGSGLYGTVFEITP